MKMIKQAVTVAALTAALAGVTIAPAGAAVSHVATMTDKAGLVIDVSKGVARKGAILVAWPAAAKGADKAEQFSWDYQGKGNWKAEYAPGDKLSGLCMAEIQFAGWARLEPCRKGSRWQVWHRSGSLLENTRDGSVLTAGAKGQGIYNPAGITLEAAPPSAEQEWTRKAVNA